MKYKRYLHNPPHIFVDDTYYFLTAATYKKRRHFDTTEKRDFLEKCIIRIFHKYGWELTEYVIFDNHYHIKGKSKNGKEMPLIFRDIHRDTSNYLKRKGVKMGLKIWWNYWDILIHNLDQYEFYTYYIWLNPVKHGYVYDSAQWKWMKLENVEEMGEDRSKEILGNKELINKIYDDF
ncbi:MAG: transposase [Candidatus Marinimicrobia bacterium]|nr:transposase [Candidatus Neomarinimicrobiota bacterium]MBL7047581.1 transposase [Candidatus Neomarinimicrobiota bacterium]